jgi:hypothetical protein
MAFEKTQNKLDELRNLTWQNGKLIEQNQQLLDQLENGAGAIGSEIMVGKQSLVDAIEYKGGTSSADKTLKGIAEDIKEIPNFDQYFRLAGVLAGSSYNKNQLQGHNENVAAGSITEIIDQLGSFIRLNDYAFSYWDLLEYIEMSALISLGSYVFRYSSIKNFVGINVSSIGTFAFGDCIKLTNITLGTLTSMSVRILTDVRSLRNITIGQGTDIDLYLQEWYATNVIAEGQSGIDELNENLYNNLLTKLYDHSTDGQTRTLRLGWLAKVSQENIDYANSKGWTLTT